MELTTMHPTNRQTMRKRTVKIWRLQDDGRRLFAGTIVAGSPAELVAMWSAFLVTAERGVDFGDLQGHVRRSGGGHREHCCAAGALTLRKWTQNNL